MPPDSLDTAIQEADAALETSKAHQHSKGEKALEKIGNITLEGDSIYESLASNEGVAVAYSLIKDKVSNFAENCQVLVDTLDEVAKIHPFIGVVVGVFKVGLKLEQTRRGNEEKIVALYATMSDTLQTLVMLKEIVDPEAPGSDGHTIKDRLKQRMEEIIDSIKSCAKLCDSYQKRHSQDIQFQLQIHASVGIATANLTLTAMSKDMDKLVENIGRLMKEVFERMRSPEEREVASLVSSRGLDAQRALENPKLLEQMIAIGKSKEEKALKRPGDVEEDRTMTILELKREVNKDVEQIIADNQAFEQKFAIVQKQLDEVKDEIQRASDRVIHTILGGPHEGIIDSDIYKVWTEMGWRGRVKAKHLVTSLWDHFAESSPDALAIVRDITILRVQPLIEALDADLSSFVSVKEINAFTAARPRDWSLSQWISYWMYGFEITVQWYFRRIRKVFAEIHGFGNAAMPSNLQAISRFFSSWSVHFVEDMLSGLRDIEEWEFVDWDRHHVFLRFKEYVVNTEKQMEERLRTFRYCLDDANTLTIVAGESTPEKYVLPLVFLLMRRALWIVQEAGFVALHDHELEVVSSSLSIVMDAVQIRVRTLRTMFKLQNINEEDQLSRFFYGLYKYTFEEAKMGPYWALDPTRDQFQIEEDITAVGYNSSESPGPVPLFHGPWIEDIDLLAYQALTTAVTSSSSDSLIGQWSGSFTYGGVGWGQGLLSLAISTHSAEDGSIHGSGIDALGPFMIKGTLKGNQLTFLKESECRHDGHGIPWQYQGIVDEENGRITGTVRWAWWPSESPHSEGTLAANETSWDNVGGISTKSTHGDAPQDALSSGTDDTPPSNTGDDTSPSQASIITLFGSDSETQFCLKRGTLDYLLGRPSDQEFTHNRPRALWKLALNYAVAQVAQNRTTSTLSWVVLLGQHRRLFELIVSKQQYRRDSAEAQELASLIKGVRRDDVHLQRRIETFKERRQPIHSFSCDSCGAVPAYDSDTTVSSQSRYICIDCSKQQVDHTIDLCASCFFDNKPATRKDLVHSPSHNILQLRTRKLRVYLHSLLSDGGWALDSAASLVDSVPHKLTASSEGERPGAFCLECKKQIKGPPYWCCVDCHRCQWRSWIQVGSPVFVCYECNEQVEQDKPWLTQLFANADYRGTHDWSHTLVSVPCPDKVTAGSVSEERLTHLEERLARLEEKSDKGLEMLEKLFAQLRNKSD
ncbi:hypothetical protein V8D89_009643 [Ganoderma adspersum]